MKSNGLNIAVPLETQVEQTKWLLLFYHISFIIAILYLAMSWIQFFNPFHYAYIASTTIYTLSLTAYNVVKEYSRKIYGSRVRKRKGEIWIFIWIANIIVLLYWQLNSNYYIGAETWSGFTMIIANYVLSKIAKRRNKQLKFISVA